MKEDEEFSEEESEEGGFEEDSEGFEDIGEDKLNHELRISGRKKRAEEDLSNNSSFSDDFGGEDFSSENEPPNVSPGSVSLGTGTIQPIRRFFRRLEDVAEEAPIPKDEDEDEENKKIEYSLNSPKDTGGSGGTIYTEQGNRTRGDFDDEPVSYLTPANSETASSQRNSLYSESRAEGPELYKSGKRERFGEKKNEREKERERLEKFGLSGSLRRESVSAAEEEFGESSNEDRVRKYH